MQTFTKFTKKKKKPNRSGLVKLLKKNVELEVFQGTSCWKELLKETAVTDMKYLLGLATSPQRTNREKEDKKILEELESEAKGK